MLPPSMPDACGLARGTAVVVAAINVAVRLDMSRSDRSVVGGCCASVLVAVDWSESSITIIIAIKISD